MSELKKHTVERHHNTIKISERLSYADLPFLLSELHQCVDKAGFQDVTLDFSDCNAAFGSVMLAVCSQAANLTHSGHRVNLHLPKNKNLSKLFQNSNWAYLIDPYHYEQSSYKGWTHIPATTFKTNSEQQSSVDKIANSILGAIPNMRREDFAAFEWSINELTDNVLTHSQSSVGGLIQVSNFKKNNKRVEFVIADAGLGIPKTLRESDSSINSDADALDRAIREGVTRDKSLGQGNGLFGSYNVCSQSDGYFKVYSGFAKLEYSPKYGFHVSRQKVPYSGTLIIAAIDFSNPKLLAQALSFSGKQHYPTDYIENIFEAEDLERLHFIIKDNAESLGSRVAGTPVRNKIENILQMCPDKILYIDFRDVPLISSSFADEVIAKLFVSMGAIGFMNKIKIINATSTISQLIDKAILQRSKV